MSVFLLRCTRDACNEMCCSYTIAKTERSHCILPYVCCVIARLAKVFFACVLTCADAVGAPVRTEASQLSKDLWSLPTFAATGSEHCTHHTHK